MVLDDHFDLSFDRWGVFDVPSEVFEDVAEDVSVSGLLPSSQLPFVLNYLSFGLSVHLDRLFF
jgi:hypothetical protein